MSENKWPDSRFLVPDMFSLSFEPEILTFLWGVCAKKADDFHRDYRQSSLLQIFVPQNGQQANFVTCLKYAVVTGGITLIVGISSFGIFKTLQKLRCAGFGGIQSSIMNFMGYCQGSKTIVESASLELVLHSGSKDSRECSSSSNDIIERPSDLALNGHSNGSPPISILQSRLVVNTQNNNLSISPINGEIATGDEDVGECHGQYFGPMTFGTEVSSCGTIESFAFESPQAQSPGTELMLRNGYENLSKPYLPPALVSNSKRPES